MKYYRFPKARLGGPSVHSSRQALLKEVRKYDDITFIRLYGNIGDELIYAGARQLFSGRKYREVAWTEVEDRLDELQGEAGVLAGSGGWCQPFHLVPSVVSRLEGRFEQLIILPSTFDVGVPEVRKVLQATRAHVFARDPESFSQIQPLCKASLAHDCAFFFDFSPYRIRGVGHLTAYRTDAESALNTRPPDNNDISVSCGSLDEWLWAIARHQVVHTDRAHVMIAAALLGKKVFYCPSTYHKVPAIAKWALRSRDVTLRL
jgi:hypothetical protein